MNFSYRSAEIKNGYEKILNAMSEYQLDCANRYMGMKGELPLPCPLTQEELDEVANDNVCGLTDAIADWYHFHS